MNDNLRNRLYNKKFMQALQYLEGETEDTKITVRSLAQLFGNMGDLVDPDDLKGVAVSVKAAANKPGAVENFCHLVAMILSSIHDYGESPDLLLPGQQLVDPSTSSLYPRKKKSIVKTPTD